MIKFTVLQQPSNVRAVWTNNEQHFYICWELPVFGSHPVDYNIFDTGLVYLNLSHRQCNESFCCANLSPLTSEDNVFIQATSLTALPSIPLLVHISGKGNSISYSFIINFVLKSCIRSWSLTHI